MSRFIYFFVFLSVFFACSSETDRIQNGENALVEVKGSVLNKQEVLNSMPKGLSASDSIQFVDSYVKTWIGTELLYDQALRNVPNLPEIDKLAELYRKQLIIFEYQKQLITERLEQQISETEMENFYEMYADKFKLNSAIIKGLFLKVPEDAPQIEDVKKWCRTTDAQSIENIEKYSLKNAIIYEYFMDKWVSFSDVMDNIPYTVADETSFLRNNKILEVQDNGYWYLLKISDYMGKGSLEPFDFAKTQIQEILINRKKKDFFKEIEKEMYNDALRKDQIQIYNWNQESSKEASSDTITTKP